ncbi:MAG: hypothetical protein P8N93_06100 [Flavobacteriaceae bacterium]|nr:hypothetical protein [Flavobacteriaceae bacterium]
MKRHIYIVILLVMVFSCSKEDSGDSNSPDSKQEYSAEIAGAVAKGAYKAGSDITFYELNDNLSQTGKSFSTNTIDDYGTFSLSVESITENYARVEGNGYYWNEITNTVTEQKLRLNAICEVNDEINLNILTHLEYDRVIELVQNQGKTFAEAKSQALYEILTSFGMEYNPTNGYAESYNFNKADDSSKILLFISVALLYNNSQSEISSLITQISNDLKDNGEINSPSIYKEILSNLGGLSTDNDYSFDSISQNVYEFYKDLDPQIASSSFNIVQFKDDSLEKYRDKLNEICASGDNSECPTSTLSFYAMDESFAKVEEDVFTVYSGAESWIGFYTDAFFYNPLVFYTDHQVTFIGSTPNIDVDVTFRFEQQPPDWEPRFDIETVTISGNSETAYSVSIPKQGEQTFTSAVILIDARDIGVTIKDVKIGPVP